MPLSQSIFLPHDHVLFRVSLIPLLSPLAPCSQESPDKWMPQ